LEDVVVGPEQISVSVIRLARERRGIGVRELARLTNVTPGAVIQWEASERRGAARAQTIARALAAMGTSPESELPSAVDVVLERREDRVTLELHRAVAAKLVWKSSDVMSVVDANLEQLRTRVRGTSALADIAEWERLANGKRIGALIDRMLGSDSRSISMRQTSPFMGVLSNDERLAAIARASE
jgi:transcriptional regulator with XRE-family HTH domain